MPNRLLIRSSRRYALQHPWLALLSVLGVALGVALVVAIDLANTSASRAFELSAASVTGEATHAVVSGTPRGVPDSVYRALRVEAGVRRSAPVVEGYARAVGYEGRTLHVLGIDPLAEGPFRPYLGIRGFDLGAFMAGGGAALLGRPTAEEMGLARSDTLRVRTGGVEHALRVIGLIEPENDRSARALSDLLVVDVSTAQRLFDQAGRLSRIDLKVPDDAAGEEMLAEVRAALPEGYRVERSETRTSTVEQMTEAFNLNLTALSLLALVVGTFLIYNTMTFSVVQRRPLIGRLRALGVTRGEVFGLVLGEAAVIGVLGTALGLVVGVLLAQGLVRLVTQTINDLYYVVTVRELAVEPLTLVKGAALGLGATLLATLRPAREATEASPSTVLRRSQQETQARASAPRLAVAGVVLGLAGAALLFVPGAGLGLSYAGLLGIIVAFALATPAAVLLFARAARPVMDRLFGVLGRMAARGVATALSRTAVAIAALTIAIAATVGVGVMVDSFRATVSAWLGYTLQSDVYVQAPSLVFRRADAALQPDVVQRLRTTPGVAAVHTVRSVQVETVQGRADLVALEPGPGTADRFLFKAGDEEAVWRDFGEEPFVIVSEPYAFRHGLGVGDTLRLQTDRGLRALPVRAVYYDYASEQGVVMMARALYDRLYDDPNVSGVALAAAEGVSVDALIERLRERAGGEQELVIRSNRDLREASLEVFDRTFTVTLVLRLLAVVVAFVGVLSALMALQLERSRELAVLRATGMTPRQLWEYVTLQTGLMGLVAGLLSLPLGLVMAYVLVFVINRRSFGWTLRFDVAPELLLQAVAVAFAAALLAGLYPSYRMAQARPADALREE